MYICFQQDITKPPLPPPLFFGVNDGVVEAGGEEEYLLPADDLTADVEGDATVWTGAQASQPSSVAALQRS